MAISSESFRMLGTLCYLNFPKYLQDINKTCIDDIFNKIEEEIEEFAVQIDELENNYRLIKNINDKNNILDKINNKKIQITNMKNQLNFIKK